jgi:hypothetical protein
MALVCWACSHWPPNGAWSSLLGTAGCLANLGHVLLAFDIVHAWDHDLAYAAVAAQTFEQTGFDTGVGLYINYSFTGMWLLDALSWWLIPRRYARRPRWLDGIVQFIFVFMFFNATVVFGKSPIRLLGALLCLMGAIGWAKRNGRQRNEALVVSRSEFKNNHRDNRV